MVGSMRKEGTLAGDDVGRADDLANPRSIVAIAVGKEQERADDL